MSKRIPLTGSNTPQLVCEVGVIIPVNRWDNRDAERQTHLSRPYN